jgi:hypothetical protein
MSWKEKYSFWREPKIDGWAYRYKGDSSEPHIDRCPLPLLETLEQRRAYRGACRWELWLAFDVSDEGEGECKREWRRMCDLAGPDEAKPET